MPPLALWRALEARALGGRILPSPSLDVGGWDGSFAATWLGDHPPLDIGLDISPVPTVHSDRAYRRVIAGDAQSLPFEAASLNSVLCNSVIEHIPDDVAVVRECGRVLRPGGVLLLTTPSVYFHEFLHGVRIARATNDELAAQAYIAGIDARLQHLHYRSISDWTAILGEAGLKLASSSYYLPQRVTTFWDRLDNWFNRPILGRARWQWLKSGRLRRIVPPRLWARLYEPFLRQVYRSAISETDTESLGASIFLMAVRR
jgi:SAM-dependent methyltransferase